MISYTDGDDITLFYHMNTKTKKVDKTRLKSDEEIKKISHELDIISELQYPSRFILNVFMAWSTPLKPDANHLKLLDVQNPLKNVYIVGG